MTDTTTGPAVSSDLRARIVAIAQLAAPGDEPRQRVLATLAIFNPNVTAENVGRVMHGLARRR